MSAEIIAFPIKETEKRRVERLRSHFERAHWPVPWRVEVSRFMGRRLVIYFTDKATGQVKHGDMSIKIKRNGVHLSSLFLEEAAQGHGAGRNIAAFLFDELAGQGENLTTLFAMKRGGYFWQRIGVRLNDDYSPNRLLSHLVKTTWRMGKGKRWDFFKKWARVFSPFTSMPDDMWRFSDFEDRLPSGEKASNAILNRVSYRGHFDANNAQSVARLKAYAPNYRFRHL